MARTNRVRRLGKPPRIDVARLADWWAGRETVHFLHIGKTGGTALQTALADARPPRARLVMHRHAVRLRDIPRGQKVVFFVRDPVSRFVSGFYGGQRQDRPRYDLPWSPGERAAFERFATANGLAEALSTSDPVERAAAEAAMASIRHVKTSYGTWLRDERRLLSRLDDLYYIGFQEALDADFAALCRKLRLGQTVRLPADDEAAHRNPRSVPRKLSAQATANLRAWYAVDCALFDACVRLAPRVNGRGAP